MRRLQKSPVACKEAVALGHLVGRGNDEHHDLDLAVVGHKGGFSELTFRPSKRKRRAASIRQKAEAEGQDARRGAFDGAAAV